MSDNQPAGRPSKELELWAELMSEDNPAHEPAKREEEQLALFEPFTTAH